MENSVEERLAAVSRALLKGTHVCSGLVPVLLHAVLYPVRHRTRALCSVHHVAAANMEPTGLGIGEKVMCILWARLRVSGILCVSTGGS